eukprot:scaffold114342_cov38-Attheya_sp.AAC.2
MTLMKSWASKDTLGLISRYLAHRNGTKRMNMPINQKSTAAHPERPSAGRIERQQHLVPFTSICGLASL